MPDRTHATTDGLRAGQTDAGDQRRLHLLTEHYEPGALILTDDEALLKHDDRHHGPAAPRFAVHADQPDSLHWNFDRALSMLAARGDGTLDDAGQADLEALWAAHLSRAAWSGAGAARSYNRVTRHTVSIMPEGFPQRHYWTLDVEPTRTGQWIVRNMNEIVNADGEWDHLVGGIPDDYLFTEEEAIALAERIAPVLEVSDKTAMERLWEWMVQQRG